MSTGSEVYITPAQYQEWKRQTTRTYAGPTPTSRAPTASTAPETPAPAATSSGQTPAIRTESRAEDLIEG